MRIISFIDQNPVIEKILRHLHLWDSQPEAPPADALLPELVYESFLDELPFEFEDGALN